MRYLPSYANVKARLVYLHIAMSIDIETYTCVKSLRQIGRELGMTLAEVRHAVKQLESDRLIATHTATHTATHNGTHLTTQLTTHLTILINNENGAPNGAPNDTPNDTPDDTPNDTPDDTQNNNNKKIKKESLHTHDAHARKGLLEKILSETLGLNAHEAAAKAGEFLTRQELKKKTWTDEGDLIAHAVSWAEKRIRKQQAAGAVASSTDEAARIEENRRRKEELESRTEAEKRTEELDRLRRWVKDWRDRGQDAAPLLARIRELEDQEKKKSLAG